MFPIVGIGASAGGLEACTQLLEHLPPATGMAFVLVQHRAPSNESILSELLSKATTMSVREVQDGMRVEPDHVYVIPTDADMTLSRGVLRLVPLPEPYYCHQHMPVDTFFTSLAQDRHSNAIGVVLSGTGSDGSRGVEAIKAEGGIIFVQDDQSAKYDGMPKSAAATGGADFILSPEKIADELTKISRHPFVTRSAESVQNAGQDNLNRIFLLIRTATGVDFSYYKQSMIVRRIMRRALLHNLDTIEQYVQYLQENTMELGLLYQDLLINFTSFFREPETFNTIKNKVLPRIFERASSDKPIRVWVPGCSTGEEVYSLAICFWEFSKERGASHPIQFFASDVDKVAIQKARRGIYAESIIQSVSSEQLKRFFSKTKEGYQIIEPIRDLCVFARQNLVNDPPFSKMDLISCRNLMIYFGPELQKKVLQIMHYALNPSGYLVLGKSESIGEFHDIFSEVDKSSHIYSKKAGSTALRFEVETSHKEKADVEKRADERAPDVLDIQKTVDHIIMSRYSPPGLIINEDMDILQFRGDISPYLKPQPGKASLNLAKMAGKSLVMELRILLRKARRKDAAVRKEEINVRQNRLVRTINIEVIPFKRAHLKEHIFLILFEDISKSAVRSSKKPGKAAVRMKGGSREDGVALLRRELADTQQHLKAVMAEYEESAEEQKALNEEAQCSNEELQSINEELETSKEELQSTNEELYTLNDELLSRNNEISQINNDLISVLDTVNIPLLLIGSELRIRRFNTAAEKALDLVASDVDRSIFHVSANINIPDLDHLLHEAVNSLTVRKREVQYRQGRWYSLTIRPYKTADNRFDGALISLEDINDVKQGLLRIQEFRGYADAIVETVREPFLILNKDLRVAAANHAYYKEFAVTPAMVENKSIYDLQDGRWNIPKFRSLLEEIVTTNTPFTDFQLDYEVPGVGRRVLLLNARKSAREGAELILLAIENITERRSAEEK